VIHGDVKSDNVLVCPADGGGGPGVEVRVVDWEFVQVGDPAWDLAGALHDWLVFWTSTMPLDPALSPGEMADRADHPIETLRGAIRAFWDGYRSASGLAAAEADDRLGRAVAFSAVRLIQAALELSAEEDELPTQTVILLQVSAHLLADPRRARSGLYGLPGGPWA
jgi:aminoglycoside phosphotransferase (APT) family kinase protein